VYERPDGVKLVISTFNLTCELEEAGGGFSLHLAPNQTKQAKASVFRSMFGETMGGATTPGVCTRIDVSLGHLFNSQAIEVHETKTRIKVQLPRQVTSKVSINRVRGD
jgi:hypothetical protein